MIRSAIACGTVLGMVFCSIGWAPSSEAKSAGLVKVRPPLNSFKFTHVKFGHFAPPPSPPPAVTSFFSETYGAKRDGQTNDLPAIQQAIATAASRGKVVFSTGTYACASQMIASGVSLVGNVNSNLLFTNPNNGGVKLTGTNASMSRIAINYSNTALNGGVGLLIFGASNFAVNGVVVNACPSDNIECFYSGPGSITSSLVTSSNASSLLIKDCTSVTVNGNQMPNIEVVSGGAISTGLIISNNTFTTTNTPTSGYVPKLAGIFNSSFTNNTIVCGSLYLGPSNHPPANPNSADGDVYNVYVAGNTLDGSAIAPSISNFLRIVVNQLGNSGSTCTTLSLVTNRIQNLSATFAAIELGTDSSDINVSGNIINTIGRHVNGQDFICYGILADTVSNINIQSNSFSNTSLTAIKCLSAGGTGYLSIINNAATNACFTTPSGSNDYPVFGVNAPSGSTPSNPLSITMTGNYYAGPANSATAFLECLTPSSTCPRNVSGNSQATVLPNNIAP